MASEIISYKLDVFGISEARWMRSWKKLLATGETMLFSGHEGEKTQTQE